ncbi:MULTISPECIES: hypothetical protein [Clostridium]|uniref:hypothetical protein n=1 Tax=Clostridium TaxID=1485 RepID=UPI000823FD6E|nr:MULTISPECIES: hypothetical protein [Clostridium]PJI09924.1 hypothetical protein CUB90_19530 [Clostridium sp. CT7]
MDENNFLPYDIKTEKVNRKNKIVYIVLIVLAACNLIAVGALCSNYFKYNNLKEIKIEDKTNFEKDNIDKPTENEISKRYNNRLNEFFCIINKFNWTTVIIKDNLISFNVICGNNEMENMLYEMEKSEKFKVQDVCKGEDDDNSYNLNVKVELHEN